MTGKSQARPSHAINLADVSPANELLHTLFLKQVKTRPDAVAVITPSRRLTYGELHRRAMRIAIRLREFGVQPNTLVAIVSERGWEQPVAALGILYAGAAYLPVAAHLPSERRRQLLHHGEVKIVLTQSSVARQIDWPENVRNVCVDEEGEWPGELALPVQRPEDLAYVICTSGSTGIPKGVMIDHRGAVNTILDMNRRFAITPADRVLSISALSFDLSVYDIFGMLAAGGAIVMPGAQAARDPAHWVELAVQEGVTIWNSVPLLMKLFCESAVSCPNRADNKLRQVWLSGDWIPLNLPDEIRALAPNVEITSLGGATEASIWSIFFPVESVDPTWSSIPYGRALTNQTFHVLDDTLEPCPPPVVGQLYIGGIGLAKGYWRDPVRTAESFIIHPQTGARLYRTGDLGRWLPDGNIELCGREDLQVKIRGIRVELGEIEAVLLQHPALSAVVVTAPGERHSERRLVACVVPRGCAPAPRELREFLLDKLPDHMLPADFIVLDRLPLTGNGKVDRRALTEFECQPDEPGPAYVAPRTAREQMVAKIWTEVLGVSYVGIHDNFLDRGGQSLAAMQILSRLRAAYAVELTVRILFEMPTVAELAELLEDVDRIRLTRETSYMAAVGCVATGAL